MKAAPILAMLVALLLGGCYRSEGYEASDAFNAAFGKSQALGVMPVNGFHRASTEWGVEHTEVWFLQLRGPGATTLVFSRWRDLRPYRGKNVPFVATHPKLIWWNEMQPRARLESASDPRYTFEVNEATGDWFISYRDDG